jgi:hypothetical protein
MQSTTRRVGAVIALVVAAGVLFVALSDDDDGGEKAATTTIVVRGGEPVGGVQELEYATGDEVRFDVRSDAAEEVHVHGYDLTQDTVPGKAITFEFPADIEGIFEVELEETHTQIAELMVEPG